MSTRSGWRLILDGAVQGAFNMAADAELLAARAAGDGGPVVRLYRWARPTVSIGRFQDEADVRLEECVQRGFDVVRRPTGGRGVLHADELTYSVVAGVDDGVPRGVAASYRYLCAALVEAYRALGIEAELTARDRGASGSAACYLHTTRADLSLGAAKLSGSAQVWQGTAVLQHGSFVLSRDIATEAAVFGLCEADAAALASETRTITEALGVRPAADVLEAAIIEGFERTLGASADPRSWSERERASIMARRGHYEVLSQEGDGAVTLR